MIVLLVASVAAIALPKVEAATWHVYPGAGTPIQTAVDSAIAGDRIMVHPGTYDEQVVIDKSLTLQGYGSTTIIKPSSASKLAIILDGHWSGNGVVAGIIVVNVADGSSVTVRNLKVDGTSVTEQPAGADNVAGIFYRETGGRIDTVTVTGVRVEAAGTAVRGYGMILSASTNTVSVEVKSSTINNFDKNAIDAEGNTLAVNIHHNTITGRGPLPEGDECQNGVLVTENAVGTVNSNTIRNLVYAPETWWSAAIMFYEGGGSAGSNRITNCQIGVIFQDGSGTATGNTVNGGTVGLQGLWAQYVTAGMWTVSFVDNTVSGIKDSIYPWDTSAVGGATYNAGAVLTLNIGDNQLTGKGSSADGVLIGDYPAGSPAGSITPIITGNSISGWQNGINVVSSTAHGLIEENYCEKSVVNGIFLSSTSDYNMVNKNRCYNNAGDGIKVEGNYNTLIGNYARYNGNLNYEVLGTGNVLIDNQ